MLAGLIDLAEKDGVKINRQLVKKISPQLKSRIKGQIARNLFDDNAMIKVSLESDQDFKKALQVALNYTQYTVVRQSK
jgi:hypothetical protein